MTKSADNKKNILPKPFNPTGTGKGVHNRQTRREPSQARSPESAYLLKLLLESPSDVIYSLDRDLRILSVSDSVTGLLGYRPEELLEQDGAWLPILTPESLRKKKADVERILGGATVRGSDYEFIAKDGARLIGEVSGAPIIYNGEIIGVVCVARDQTERRQKEQELEQARSLLAATIEANTDGLLVMDNQDRTVICNQTFLSLWQLPETPAGGNDGFILTCLRDQIKDPETFLAKIQRLKTHREQDSHDWLEIKDGRIFEVLSQPQRLAGDIVGRVWTFRDVTMRRQMEAALINSEARLRALLTQMLVGVAEIDMETGLFLTVNRRLCEMLGRTEAEMLTIDMETVTHPDDLMLHKEKMHLLRKGGISFFRLEARHLRKDGAMLWVEISVSLLNRPEDDAPQRIIVVVHDITDRRRKEEMKEHLSRKMDALHRVGVDLAAELNLSVLLQSIATQAMNLLEGQSCNCYIYRPDTDILELEATAGDKLSYSKGNSRRFEGVPGYVLATNSPILVNDYHSWPLRRKEFDHLPNRAMMATPIRLGTEFLGVLNVLAYAPQSFSDADFDLLNLFAMQAAIAIRNARLYREVEQLSVTDALTNLLNRRGFNQLAERELDRALRFSRPLAALMIDIDNFKQVNDTCGHAMGDRIICDLADLLRQNTRSVDIVSRHGGDEFVLIMPEISFPEALQTAERLRLLIASLPIPILAEPNLVPPGAISVTVSMGVSVLPEKGGNLTELLNLADQGLFRAKRLGRNRIEGTNF